MFEEKSINDSPLEWNPTNTIDVETERIDEKFKEISLFRCLGFDAVIIAIYLYLIPINWNFGRLRYDQIHVIHIFVLFFSKIFHETVSLYFRLIKMEKKLPTMLGSPIRLDFIQILEFLLWLTNNNNK